MNEQREREKEILIELMLCAKDYLALLGDNLDSVTNMWLIVVCYMWWIANGATLIGSTQDPSGYLLLCFNVQVVITSSLHHLLQVFIHTQGHVQCEGPNKRLYEFTGNMMLDGKTEPIQSDQILLRGAQLRNTEWIYGLVVYSGHDTKLLQNASRAPLKRSRMDHIINKQVTG